MTVVIIDTDDGVLTFKEIPETIEDEDIDEYIYETLDYDICCSWFEVSTIHNDSDKIKVEMI